MDPHRDNSDEMLVSGASQQPASSEQPRFTIDEGFAEESHNYNGNHQIDHDATAAHFQQWIQAQRPDVRAEVAYEILRTLRTSQISDIVERLMPLLHMDPIEKLPAEVTLMIFSHLDAATLLTATLASQTWRERILDPKLWQELYMAEGWRIDTKEVKAFEQEHASLVRHELKKAKGHMRHSIGKGQPLLKRRATSDWLDSKQRRVSADVAHWREQHGVVEADIDGMDNVDQEMHDVGTSALDSPQRPNKRHSNDSGDEMDYSQDTDASAEKDFTSPMHMLVEDAQGHVKLNWPLIYKQRYKLEQNWLKGRYTNFQLPHPDHPHEAHTECVYTIQFYGKWLVSGSRDKSLRIWDLETQRLRGKPLTGHSQSVLCLQFDPTPEEDIIISGSSDSSVIVWKFSTGQKLHVIPSAHEESVLNLKFDKRYLVTCSKDKKIKIWNRNAMTAMDPDYPRITDDQRHAQNSVRVPSYIVDVSSIEPSLLEAKIANGHIKSLQPYVHLMTLDGHAAAVNAIQISGDLIVSASGDRLIRVWSIKSGVCLRVLPGHQKGIACVQFDNKRIVSGSSDNTVRVYDLVTGMECAVLLGHTNLVRTVQAGFGDAPGSEEDDYAAAKEAERACIEDLENARLVNDRHALRRIRMGEAGSSRSGLGATLPPGGGGSKWGRIVSGSYDEAIIVWKKDAKGQWVIGQTLRQDAAVRASVESSRSAQQSGRPPRSEGRTRNAPGQTPANGQGGHRPAVSASQAVQQAMHTSMTGLQTSIQSVITRGLNGSWSQTRTSTTNGASSASAGSIAPVVQAAANRAINGAQAAAVNAVQQIMASGSNVQLNVNVNNARVEVTHGGAPYNRSVTSASSAADAAITTQDHNQTHPATPAEQVQNTPTQPPAAQQPTQPQQAGQPNTPNQNATQQGPAHAHGHGHGHGADNQHAAAQGGTAPSRVFKLQFDARRIVCCSQDSRIIGWDFANKDPEVEAACRFFVGP